MLKAKMPEEENTGLPAAGGYSYHHVNECVHDGVYGDWVKLTPEKKALLASDFMNNRSATLVKNNTCAADPAMAGVVPGGTSVQLPITADDVLYFNKVGDRLPFGLEKGLQIKAKAEDKKDGDSWSGKVAHLDQIFHWRREHPTIATVSFEVKDFRTWETDLSGLPGVRLGKMDLPWWEAEKARSAKQVDSIEFPTTHIWTDLDNFEMSWFYHDRCVARKKFYVPFWLSAPLSWAIGYGIRRLEKGEKAVEEESEEGSALK
jgi:hypothetical protein